MRKIGSNTVRQLTEMILRLRPDQSWEEANRQARSFYAALQITRYRPMNLAVLILAFLDSTDQSSQLTEREALELAVHFRRKFQSENRKERRREAKFLEHHQLIGLGQELESEDGVA